MLWLWTIFGAILFVGTWWTWFQIANRRVIKLCSALPSAQPCYPILGNILTFASSLDVFIENVLAIVEKSLLEGHRAVCFWLCAYPLVFITNHEDIKTVLNNSVSRGKEAEECGKEIMKYGLLLAPVDHWKVTRRHLNLAFQPRNLEQLMVTFNTNSRQLVLDLSEHIDCPEFNIMPYVMTTALRSICTFLYGPKTIEMVSKEQIENLMHGVELAGDLMALRLARPWLRNDTVFKLFYRKDLNSVKQDAAHIASMFSNIQRFLHSRGSTEKSGNSEYGFKTILDVLINLQANSTYIRDDHMLDEIINFLSTGSDTIGISVSSCFLALASFPHIQNKVYEEICSVVPEDEDIAYAHLKRLTYLDQVIKETLRYFTVVPFTSRALTRDIDLDGYTVPANKLIVLCLSAACFDPKYFPDPHKFDPDRFSAGKSLDDGVYMPFSRGPRNCIGKTYAIMLMKVMVVHVVRKYHILTHADIRNLKKVYKVTLALCNGYNVLLKNRSK